MSRCEVQSPGFTSRLTNIVRARQENPQYSRVGNLPLVKLSRYVVIWQLAPGQAVQIC